MAGGRDARALAASLRGLGYPVVEVDSLGGGAETIAVVRLPVSALPSLGTDDRDAIARLVREHGFRHATLDLDAPPQ